MIYVGPLFSFIMRLCIYIYVVFRKFIYLLFCILMSVHPLYTYQAAFVRHKCVRYVHVCIGYTVYVDLSKEVMEPIK